MPSSPDKAREKSLPGPAKKVTPLVESCWDALLLLAKRVKAHHGPLNFCVLRIGGDPDIGLNRTPGGSPGSILIAVSLAPSARLPKRLAASANASLRLSRVINLSFIGTPDLPLEIIDLLRLYLPICFLSLRARQHRRAVTLSHFAQSLDGWMATISGDSKWIGSPGNLIHSHRMRALFDAVLVGAHTLSRDKPQLTVRYVRGDNPVRVVLGKTFAGIESLFRSSFDPVILIGGRPPYESSRFIALPLGRKNGFVPTVRVLRALYKRGVHSVYIEGGAITASRFLQENTLDIIQVHISPMILGPGLPVFLIPPVQRVNESLRFDSFFYTAVDDGIMFTGVFKGKRA